MSLNMHKRYIICTFLFEASDQLWRMKRFFFKIRRNIRHITFNSEQTTTDLDERGRLLMRMLTAGLRYR